jgi:hypothetical protein
MRTTGDNPRGICKLCHTPGIELIESHLVPSGAYRILEKSGGCISVNQIQGILKPNQWRDHLLCTVCEDRFNKGGEDWVLRNCFRGQKFKLSEILEHADPFKQEDGVAAFKGAEIPGVDVNRLEYFAASMFWRASCHDWGYEKRTVLGHIYEEQFREFLLGRSPWPTKVWLTIGCVPTTRTAACLTFGLPKLDSDEGYWSHRIRFLGIMFLLSVGNLVPKEIRTYSAQNPERFIVMGDAITYMVVNDINAVGKAEYKGKAKKLVAPFLERKTSL